jgi:hypothetical protein
MVQCPCVHSTGVQEQADKQNLQEVIIVVGIRDSLLKEGYPFRGGLQEGRKAFCDLSRSEAEAELLLQACNEQHSIILPTCQLGCSDLCLPPGTNRLACCSERLPVDCLA